MGRVYIAPFHIRIGSPFDDGMDPHPGGLKRAKMKEKTSQKNDN
jgi:hypothetical protein